MKKLLIVFLILSTISFAQKKEIKHVITHNKLTITCDATKGNNIYKRWGLFPKENYPIRTISMNVTLGSPDSLNTAHWDYLDHITIRRKGGEASKSIDYELGRMLTPYGSIFNKGWSWKWKVDVSDFASLLRDSVEIEYNHSGYEAKTVGWALTIDFEIVSGSEIAPYLGLNPLWNGHYKYGDSTCPIEKQLKPISYISKEGSVFNRIRIQHTGHGMDKPKNCSEFCPRWRLLKIDGEIVDQRNMWKDCGKNPLYPQGGTWVYDRAYWCPGDLQVPDFIDIPVKQGSHLAEIEIEPYTATDNIQANEVISSFLFQYGTPKAKNDAEIQSIMVPTDEQQYTRLNPSNFNPRFVIRNLGSDNLKTLEITYGTEGFPFKVYHWVGNLKFNQTEEIQLLSEIMFKEGKNTFKVSVSKPNGKKDEWNGDNEMVSSFVSTQKMPLDFYVELQTNNVPTDNNVYLTNMNNDTLMNFKSSNLKPKTYYRDTLHLLPGKYELCLRDSSGDGLEFWAEPQNGDGHLRIFDLNGNLIHAFESDCGNGEKINFVAVKDYKSDTLNAKYAFSLYPRLVENNTELSVVSNKKSKMIVQITVDGVLHEKHEYISVKNGDFSYYLGNMPKGRIVLEVFMDGISRFKGRINKK